MWKLFEGHALLDATDTIPEYSMGVSGPVASPIETLHVARHQLQQWFRHCVLESFHRTPADAVERHEQNAHAKTLAACYTLYD